MRINNQKKKILFVIPAYNHGGTNKSLENLLANLDKSKYNIDIFSMSTKGPYKNILYNYNHIKRSLLLSAVFDSYATIKNEKKANKFLKLAVKLIYRLLNFLIGYSALKLIYRIAVRKINKAGYDTVVAFQEGIATHFISHVKGKKIAWVRSDYSEYSKIKSIDETNVYDKFNSIITVSHFTKISFLQHYPNLKDKCHSIHNVIDDYGIQSKSMAFIDKMRFTHNSRIILTVGRLSKVKQLNIIPEIAYNLKKLNYDFQWLIIGEGSERTIIQELINKYNVADRVILLGEIDNPYPYFKKSYLYVSTSLSEACPNVINEAKILGLPVVATKFGSIYEFLEDGINGLIVDKSDLVVTIQKFLDDYIFYNKIKENLSNFKYSNYIMLKQIEYLL